MSAQARPFKVAVCVPTADRPESVRRLLSSLSLQERPFDVVLIVDASRTPETERVVADAASAFGPGSLVHLRTERGLPAQRNHGIDALSKDPAIRYLCFLDDDVVLDPGYAEKIVAFLESDEGASFGGVAGYDLEGWGKPFSRLEVTYNKLGLFDGELRPGRWLYNGRFMEVEHLAQPDGIHRCDYLPGFQTVWRMEVFDQFRPPIDMPGYALGEDKQFSLRVHTQYELGVLGEATMRHLQAAGGRPQRSRIAFEQMRLHARLLRECDVKPSIVRYLAFLGFGAVNLAVEAIVRVFAGHFRDLPLVAASAGGWITCIAAPPGDRRSNRLRATPTEPVYEDGRMRTRDVS